MPKKPRKRKYNLKDIARIIAEHYNSEHIRVKEVLDILSLFFHLATYIPLYFDSSISIRNFGKIKLARLRQRFVSSLQGQLVVPDRYAVRVLTEPKEVGLWKNMLSILGTVISVLDVEQKLSVMDRLVCARIVEACLSRVPVRSEKELVDLARVWATATGNGPLVLSRKSQNSYRKYSTSWVTKFCNIYIIPHFPENIQSLSSILEYFDIAMSLDGWTSKGILSYKRANSIIPFGESVIDYSFSLVLAYLYLRLDLEDFVKLLTKVSSRRISDA
jgi:hypothetical protein